jgi:diguanylate cyclase (GGDEF)-like protein
LAPMNNSSSGVNFALPPVWTERLQAIEIAFQPIIHPKSGNVFGLEALMRNVKKAGFTSIDDVFENAYKEDLLFSLDLQIRDIVFRQFTQLPFHKKVKLFYNFDHRVMEMKNFDYQASDKVIEKHNLDYGSLCIELSEKYRNTPEILSMVHQQARRMGFKIAIDDFGAIFAGYELLYYAEPEFIKLDRFLIAGMDKDNKKKSFCAHIVSLAHLMGISVIGEGIETEEEFYACREIDIDLQQGYFIQPPTTKLDELIYSYNKVNRLYKKNRRQPDIDARLIAQKTIPIDGINIYADTSQIKEITTKWKNQNFFAVLDNNHFPIGLITRANIDDVIKLYPTMPQAMQRSHSLRMLTKKCPVLDINLSLDKILEVFVSNTDVPGVIIISNLKYFGFLGGKSLLEIINDKNLTRIREINPLTHLPGNSSVNDFLQKAMEENSDGYFLIIFDFDNFKNFNDRFGFRQGDRLISLFAEILRKEFPYQTMFVGHMGGDDFFVGMQQKDTTIIQMRQQVKRIISDFSDTVATFYSQEEFLQGYYVSKNRHGKEQMFPLLSAKAAMLEIPSGHLDGNYESVVRMFNSFKQRAKISKEGITILNLREQLVHESPAIP